MSITEKQEALIEDFDILPDKQEKLGYIVDIGRNAPGLEDEYKIEAFRIQGCQSMLWLVPSFEHGTCNFRVDSDGMISKGTASLLANLYSGCSPEEIVRHEPFFIEKVGLESLISTNRRNGLSNVWKKIKTYAELCIRNQAAGTT